MGGAFVAARTAHALCRGSCLRRACIPFVLLGGYARARWARELYGERAGVVAVVLWTFCPNILGYGQFVIPDVAAASLAIAAVYVFYWCSVLAASARCLRSRAWLRRVE